MLKELLSLTLKIQSYLQEMGIIVSKRMVNHTNKITEINEHFKNMSNALSSEASDSLFSNVETVVGAITASYYRIETLGQALCAIRKCHKYTQKYLL
tara:strand:- start:495 stop:785 length:291 start_codon:yes stop_codon:yes gene_type:complete